MSHFKRTLDIVVNVCLVCASIAVVAMAVSYFRGQKLQTQAPPVQPLTPQLGQTLPVSLPVTNSGKTNTLLIAVREGCHFCEESMGFYKELADNAARANAQILFVLSEPVSRSSGYLAGYNIQHPQVLQADLTRLDVGGTPTLILLNQQNRITRFWVGALHGARQAEVRSAIGLSQPQ